MGFCMHNCNLESFVWLQKEVEKEEKEKVEITHCSGFETYMKAKLRDAPALSEIFETAVQFESVLHNASSLLPHPDS